MRYLTIALLLLSPINADAQQWKSQARQNVDRMLRQWAVQSALEQRANDPRLRPPRRHVDNDRFRHDRGRPDHRFGRKDRGYDYRYPYRSYYATPYVGYGVGLYSPDTYAPETYAPARDEVRTTGMLQLDVMPAAGLTFYVDGLFVGSSSNLGTQFELNPGSRRVEVRAAGYKPLVFDTRITAGEITTFRGALESLTPTAPPPARATGNPTMFIIPGCYIGNSRPTASSLRPGCDINRLITR
jgi:hypothetical protein